MDIKKLMETVEAGAALALTWATSYLEIMYGGKETPPPTALATQRTDSPFEDDDGEEEPDPREF